MTALSDFARATLGTLVVGPLALAQDVSVPADVASLQAAIDSVGPGGTVFVAPGTYVEALVIDPSGQWGAARGQASMRIVATAPGVVLSWPDVDLRALNPTLVDVDGAIVDPLLGIHSAGSVELAGLEFDGNREVHEFTGGTLAALSTGLFANASSVVVSDCTVRGFGSLGAIDGQGGGILTDGGTQLGVEDCEFLEIGRDAIRLRSASSASIGRTTFTGKGYSSLSNFSAIQVQGGSVATSDNCLFTGLISSFIFASTVSGAMEVRDSVGGNRLTNASVADCGYAFRRSGSPKEGGALDLVSNSIVVDSPDPPIGRAFVPAAVEVFGSPGAGWRVENCTFANLIGPGVRAVVGGGTIVHNNFNFNDVIGAGDNAQDNSGGNHWGGNQWSDFDSNSLSGIGQYLVPGSAGAVDASPITDFALVQNYGSACPGAGGLEPQISVTGLPLLGLASYPIQLSDALASTPTALGYSLSPSAVPVGGAASSTWAPASRSSRA